MRGGRGNGAARKPGAVPGNPSAPRPEHAYSECVHILAITTVFSSSRTA